MIGQLLQQQQRRNPKAQVTIVPLVAPAKILAVMVVAVLVVVAPAEVGNIVTLLLWF